MQRDSCFISHGRSFLVIVNSLLVLKPSQTTEVRPLPRGLLRFLHVSSGSRRTYIACQFIPQSEQKITIHSSIWTKNRNSFLQSGPKLQFIPSIQTKNGKFIPPSGPKIAIHSFNSYVCRAPMMVVAYLVHSDWTFHRNGQDYQPCICLFQSTHSNNIGDSPSYRKRVPPFLSPGCDSKCPRT